MKVLSGRVWKFGDNIDSHVFLASRFDPMVRAREYLNVVPHVLEEVRPEFVHEVSQGDLVVAGEAFGSGKHVHGVVNALRILGIEAVIARSFANTFEKEAINTGFPALTYDTVHGNVADGDRLELDVTTFQARNLTTGRTFDVEPTDLGILEILDAGGLAALTLQRLGIPA